MDRGLKLFYIKLIKLLIKHHDAIDVLFPQFLYNFHQVKVVKSCDMSQDHPFVIDNEIDEIIRLSNSSNLNFTKDKISSKVMEEILEGILFTTKLFFSLNFS